MTIKQLYTYLLLSLGLGNLIAQNFVGQITDNNGAPIIGCTVFVKDINQGMVCNDSGRYQTTLPSGVYSVEYRSMGHKSELRNVTITNAQIRTENVILKTNPIELESAIVSNKEDPAYEIMRKAIKKAPYHLKRVKSFDAESYIKGVFELLAIPKIIDKMSSVESDGVKMKLSDFKNKLFLQESYNDIEFIAPNRYTQTVKAFSSSIPDDFKPSEALDLMKGSLYEERFQGFVSPLNPDAFSYYKFRYEGFIEEGTQSINKIKVTPKYENPTLAEGYIYIAEDTWDIRNAELTVSVWGVEQNFNLSYANISDSVYMPSAYSNRTTINTLGVKGYINYFASVKYNDLQLNSNNHIESELNIKKKREFEIKPDTTYTIKTDSMALKRDSTYWLNVRNTPLDSKEIISYEKKDSIQSKVDSVRQETANSKFRFSSLISGGKVGGDSTLFQVKYGGIFRALGDYNYVDGFQLGQKIEVRAKIGDKNKLTFTPKVHYATARKDLLYEADLKFEYSPLKQGLFYITAGSTTQDFNKNAITRYDNAMSSLVMGQNYSMFYQNKHLNIGNSIDLTNGLKLGIGLFAEKRDGLHNNTDYYFTIKDKTIADYILFRNAKNRITENTYFAETSYHTAYAIRLSYFPYAYYSIEKGNKVYKQITSPIFDLQYMEGVDLLSKKNNSVYRKIQLGVRQFIKTDYFSSLSYDAQIGTFLGDKSKVNIIDYKGFNTSNIWWGIKQPHNNFMLLDSYHFSTNRYWINTHVNYSTQYLLIKRLPFLQKSLMSENVHLKGLYTPDKKFYSEAGYSLSFMGFINLGIFASFDKLEFNGCRLRLVTDLGIFKR